MSALQKRKRSLDVTCALDSGSSPDQLAYSPCQEPSHVFSNNSSSGSSRQHVGHVYNTANFNFADAGDGDAKRVIDGLYFPDIERRRDAIGDPANQTFEWLLEPESIIPEPVMTISSRSSWHCENERRKARQEAATRLTSWLRSGDGIFWAVGKAASGKSTLIKYLRNSSRVSQLLDEWASNSQIVVADHYFWHTGSDLQKSHEGLYRSLLWQIFCSNPQLVRIAWPRRSNSTHIIKIPSEKDFYEAIANLSAYGTKLCLFVDGLDEFHPQIDLDLLSGTLTNIAQLPNVKILVSCRPWQIFEAHLNNTQHKIRMEDLNWIDIETYAINTIRRYLHGSTLELEFQQPLGPEGARFIEDFVRTSQGVFLWAHLAIQRLAPKMQFADNMKQVQTFLVHFPPELGAYFKERILERINSTTEKSETASILMFKLAGCDDVCKYRPLVTEDACHDAQFGFTQEVCSRADSWFAAQLRTTTAFVTHYYRDLLFVQNAGPIRESQQTSYHQWKRARTEYTHRTVHDFLETESMAALLRAHSPPHFQHSYNLHLQAELAVLKILPPPEISGWEAYLDIAPSAEGLSKFHPLNVAYRKTVQECERLLVALFKDWSEETRAKPSTDSGSPTGQDINEQSCLEPNFTKQDYGPNVDVDAHEFVEDVRPLLWRFAFYGSFDLVRQLAQLNLLIDYYRVALSEGALGIGSIPNGQVDDDDAVFGILDTTFPLRECSISSVEFSLTFLRGPNEPGIVAHFNQTDMYRPSGRTIWHDFLFKWWRLEPRRDWGRFKRHDWWEGEASDASATIRKPSGPVLDRLPDLIEPDSSNAWKIAKLLIREGADLTGLVCLTEWSCPRLLEEDERRNGWEYTMHTTKSCWELDVAEVLRVLVPESALGELEQLLTKGGEEA